MTEVEQHVPRTATVFGLRVDPTGTHLSSSIRLEELRNLLASVPASNTTVEDYREAIVEQNVLGKPSTESRRIAFTRLRELYGLDSNLLIFRALRDLWEEDQVNQPELALLCSTARDPILRAITPFLVQIPEGTKVTTKSIAEEAEKRFPDKFVQTSRDRLSRNAAASWRMAGLLSGKQRKHRAKPKAGPTSVAYALLLGDLCGKRGQRLFTTVWSSILSTATHELAELAVSASQLGWIEYRSSGNVVEVSFRHLTREEKTV